MGYFARKRQEIRSAVYNNERQTYILLSSGAQYEAAKGFFLVAPGLVLCASGNEGVGLPILILGSVALVMWTAFVWAVAFKAAVEKSDKIYDRFTRKHLSREYRDS